MFDSGINIGRSIVDVVDSTGNALDKLFTSDDERLSRQEILERVRQKPFEWQHELNLINAKSRTFFNAGWRPSIGWACSIGFVLWLLNIFVFDRIAFLYGYPMPKVDVSEIHALIYAMMGFGGIRSFDKLKGLTS